MYSPGLVDILLLLFVLWRVFRAGARKLGESLHDLISLLLLAALVMGLRIASELQALLTSVAGFFNAAQGVGLRILIVVAAWYLLHLLRRHLADWLESIAPSRLRPAMVRISEALRALLLGVLLIWLFEGWMEPSGPDTSLAVNLVRNLDVGLLRLMAQ